VTTFILAAGVLGCLTALAVYIAGWEVFVFGIAAGIMVIGGWWVWVGVGVAVIQAARLGWRRWSGSRSRPIPN
jgi:hypothetical protein